jgi:hypothetical protein
MSDQQLYDQLEQLRQELESVGPMDADKRERLLSLIEDMESRVEPHASLIERAESAVTDFEASHPTLAGVMNRVIETLGNIGV